MTAVRRGAAETGPSVGRREDAGLPTLGDVDSRTLTIKGYLWRQRLPPTHRRHLHRRGCRDRVGIPVDGPPQRQCQVEVLLVQELFSDRAATVDMIDRKSVV